MKLKVGDAFAQRNFIYSLILYGVIILYFSGIFLFPAFNVIFSILYGIAFSIYFLLKILLNFRKLREIDAPEGYVNAIFLSYVAFIGGAILSIVTIVIGLRT